MPKSRVTGSNMFVPMKGLVTGNTRMKCQSFILQATSCKGYFFNQPTFSQSDIPFCIPLATSCGGYNVFDPSVRPSVSPVSLVSATPPKPLNRISWNFVVMKNIMCRCAYPQESFLGVRIFFNLEILPKWKILLKTVCQRHFSETAQRNFLKLCSCECRCADQQELLIKFSSWSNASFWTKMKDTT